MSDSRTWVGLVSLRRPRSSDHAERFGSVTVVARAGLLDVLGDGEARLDVRLTIEGPLHRHMRTGAAPMPHPRRLTPVLDLRAKIDAAPPIAEYVRHQQLDLGQALDLDPQPLQECRTA